MSSHVRFVVQSGGSYFSGNTAKNYLRQHTAWPVKTVQETIKAANYLGAKLWVFREPRKLSTSKSRYKKFCCLLGIGRAKRKYKPPQFHHPPTQAPAQAVPAPTWASITLGTDGLIHYNVQGGVPDGPNQPGLTTPAIGSDDLFS